MKCPRVRCIRPVRVAGLCTVHARMRADDLFSRYIRARDGECQIGDGCWGTLQCAHLFPRRYQKVQFDPQNAVALCQKHHMKMDQDPIRKDLWMQERLGWRKYAELRARAVDVDGPKVDLEHVLAWLAAVRAW